jgi:hypothetical protein
MGDQRGASGAPVASEEVNARGECAAEPRRVPPERARPEPWVGVVGSAGSGAKCLLVVAAPVRRCPLARSGKALVSPDASVQCVR